MLPSIVLIRAIRPFAALRASLFEVQENAGHSILLFVTLESRYAVPAIYEWQKFATAGGLISYGTSLTSVYREVGIYVGKVLKGAKPADLPIQQPTHFELIVNLRTAKALGLTVPPTLLTAADQVIE